MKYLYSLILLIVFTNGFSQTISRKVFSTLGGFHNDSSLQVNYTIGETFTTTLSNGSLTATQGFQQPDSIKVVTASITANSATSFCMGGSVLLQANTDGVYSYQWSMNSTPINGATNSEYTANQTGNYTVRISSANNFYAVSAATVVTVYTLPIVSSTVSPSALVCGGSTVTLNGTGAVSYNWSGGISNALAFVAFTTTTYTVTGTDVHGCTATTSTTLTVKTQPTVTAISNQTYCNGQTVSAIPLIGLPSGVVFDITGGASKGLPNQTSVTAIPSFTTTANGSAVITITPKANGCVGPISTYTMTVSNCPPVTVNLKFYIQGYYMGNGLMQSVLFNEGEVTDPNSVLTDYVIVELHSITAPFASVKTTIATLKTNGTLTCNFPGSVTNTPFYIVLHHRNAIETWSANPVTITPNMTYDFSNAANKAYGNNQKDAAGNGTVWALYNGDINQDENMDLLDLADLEADINDFAYGYFATDLNGDGNVDLLDVLSLEDNVTGFIFSVHP